jgi:hypothetical protein
MNPFTASSLSPTRPWQVASDAWNGEKNVTVTQVAQCYTEVNVDYVKVKCTSDTVRGVLKTNRHEAGLDLLTKHRRDRATPY